MKYVRRTCCVIAAFFIILTICVPVSAQGAGSAGSGQGSGAGYGVESGGPENASLQERVSMREQTAQVLECSPNEACNATRLRVMVAERNKAYLAGQDGTLPPRNVTESAVYAFRAAAPLTGASSSDLVRLAEEINGSVGNAVRNEEQIRSQNAVMVFLFGGDHASADAIMQHVVRNRVRIEEMNRLIDECNCDPETAAILREQLQEMEQEQARFEELAAAERAKQGIFGLFG